jgi:7-carboxy-7-deazaguanine synthase
LRSNSLQVSELFFSLQGESSYSGYPCVFIRLAGCNLRCTYCDAQYTYNEPGLLLPIAAILEFVAQYPDSLVEITGGEPLVQENSIGLMQHLIESRRKTLLETNGSLDLADVPEEIIKIVDLKCPGSGMHEKMFLDNFGRLKEQDEIKCVIGSRADYDWAKKVLGAENLLRSKGQAKVTFSAVSGLLEAPVLAQWILQDNLPAKMQLQLHKILWPDKERGA